VWSWVLSGPLLDTMVDFADDHLLRIPRFSVVSNTRNRGAQMQRDFDAMS